MIERNPPGPERIAAIRAQLARLRAGESPKAIFAGLDDLLGALADMDYHAALQEVMAAKARAAVMSRLDTELIELANCATEAAARAHRLRGAYP